MQRFPCPFCGERDEREFHFAAEAGKTRPDTTETIDADTWAQYLYHQNNEKGVVTEVWMHKTCREVFLLKRNSVSMDVVDSIALRKAAT